MNQKTETLAEVAERIIRDAAPATASGATCFVPRYQIDQLRAAYERETVPVESLGRDADWPTREMVAAGTLGGMLTPNQATASFQAMMAAAAQPATVPEGWRSVIDEIRESLDSDTPSAFDNSGYRHYASMILDRVSDELDALAAAPPPEAQADDDERVELDISADGTLTYMDGRPVQVETPKPAEGGAVLAHRVRLVTDHGQVVPVSWADGPPAQSTVEMSKSDPRLVIECAYAATAGSGEAAGEVVARAEAARVEFLNASADYPGAMRAALAAAFPLGCCAGSCDGACDGTPNPHGLTDQQCEAIYQAVSMANITRDVKTPDRKRAIVRDAIVSGAHGLSEVPGVDAG